MASYDIIGDIHGHAFELMSLLASLSYQRHGKSYRHADRKVVFVGDFVDRGPAIGEVVEIARAMVDAVGHYWLTGSPTPLAANVACTDYSVAKGGKLVAYRWDGESELSADKFHGIESE